MIKTNAIVFTTLFAFCIAQNTEEKIYMKKQSLEPTTIDGPYVLYRNDSVFVKYIEDNVGTKSVKTDSLPASMRGSINLKVNTDIPGKTFNVQLKQKLSNEKTEYNGVKKMLVISDIEGNFEAFRKLLQGNKVIDENFNWTFGKDHLVLVGDFVDRGVMVTEVLWFIYSLEEKAKAAGGYVHYILGNHEIMNMADELDYVQERYIQHAQLMNKPYMQLFGPNAEIGRWLATKNVVERVGNTLFTHGGISGYMNMLNISLKELNEITRPFYTDTTYKYSDDRLNLIYSDFGPFWYRNYYKAPRANMTQIDSTLNIYGVRAITTGHTIIANEIRSLYDGKLFNVDVHHAEGRSEALLIDNGKFWRVNTAGEKFDIRPI
ncbi:MAG TPA: metallophosphoesterase [Chitinophagaceae bacterium]|nr:metallophosphoesterase [Chitinophagaceae bacterium]